MTNLQVVLPTPPFPPTKTQRSVFWSIIFLTVGSSASKSSSTSAVAMLNVSIHSVKEWDRIVMSAIHSYKGRRKRNLKWWTLFAKKETKVHEECSPESTIRMCGICCCLFVDNQSSRDSFQVGRFNYLK